ncbi:hypothetical protein V6N11_000776 [Hibiscus sabdariffa]|uniref:Uncharacterized protein n=1 Tax=Hibiscus sabdariffa TaxID=183260 RepID=A0ABR2RXP7_9ROSI
MGDIKILPGSRHRPPLKRPIWIILTVSFVSLLLLCAYLYPPNGDIACYLFSSKGCKAFGNWLPPVPTREFTDEEIISRVVVKDILNMPQVQSKNPKIAFMFLTPGSLPFEKLWDMFFRGHEGRFSVYVHASKEKPVHESRYFLNREIRSSAVQWGAFNMVDAEKRLLAYALKDPDNEHFVLLSDSCVPIRDFDYVFSYLMHANMSFVDSFVDPGPYGNGRYSTRMLPEVEEKDFRKGSQWFTMNRKHALIVMADSLYYSRHGTMESEPEFTSLTHNRSCSQPGLDGKNCIADEHYFPTFFNLIDPGGIANWSVTHVDWSERKWHPKSYRTQDVTYELLRNIMTLDEKTHITSNDKGDELLQPCLWNGIRRPCFLFARKFYPETLDKLVTTLNF